MYKCINTNNILSSEKLNALYIDTWHTCTCKPKWTYQTRCIFPNRHVSCFVLNKRETIIIQKVNIASYKLIFILLFYNNARMLTRIASADGLTCRTAVGCMLGSWSCHNSPCLENGLFVCIMRYVFHFH